MSEISEVVSAALAAVKERADQMVRLGANAERACGYYAAIRDIEDGLTAAGEEREVLVERYRKLAAEARQRQIELDQRNMEESN